VNRWIDGNGALRAQKPPRPAAPVRNPACGRQHAAAPAAARHPRLPRRSRRFAPPQKAEELAPRFPPQPRFRPLPRRERSPRSPRESILRPARYQRFNRGRTPYYKTWWFWNPARPWSSSVAQVAASTSPLVPTIPAAALACLPGGEIAMRRTAVLLRTRRHAGTCLARAGQHQDRGRGVERPCSFRRPGQRAHRGHRHRIENLPPHGRQRPARRSLSSNLFPSARRARLHGYRTGLRKQNRSRRANRKRDLCFRAKPAASSCSSRSCRGLLNCSVDPHLRRRGLRSAHRCFSKLPAYDPSVPLSPPDAGVGGNGGTGGSSA